MGQLNIRVLFGDLSDHLPPENGRRQNIGLIDRTDLFVSFPGSVKGDVADALDLGNGIFHGIKTDPFRAFTLNPFRLGKINPAGQFTNDQDIKPPFNHFGLQGRVTSQGGEDNRRPQVAKKAENFAQRQQGCSFRLLFGRQAFPLRPTDRSEQDGIGFFTDLDGRIGKSRPSPINGDPANVGEGPVEPDVKFILNGIKDFHRLGHDFRADTVTRQYGNFEYLAHK
jgi:hypothetical protein